MLQSNNTFRSLWNWIFLYIFFTLQPMYKPQIITQHHVTIQHTMTIWAGYTNLHELTLWNCLDPSKSAVLRWNSFMESSCQIFSLYCRIWSWSPMSCEKHGPRDSVDKNRGRRPRFLSLLRPEGHVFHTAWKTMIKSYYNTLADWFFSVFYSHECEF